MISKLEKAISKSEKHFSKLAMAAARRKSAFPNWQWQPPAGKALFQTGKGGRPPEKQVSKSAAPFSKPENAAAKLEDWKFRQQLSLTAGSFLTQRRRGAKVAEELQIPHASLRSLRLCASAFQEEALPEACVPLAPPPPTASRLATAPGCARRWTHWRICSKVR